MLQKYFSDSRCSRSHRAHNYAGRTYGIYVFQTKFDLFTKFGHWSSKRTSALNTQWYKIIPSSPWQTAKCCSGLFGFWNYYSVSSDVLLNKLTRAQPAPLTSWNMCKKSSRDTSSAPGSNHEVLRAAAFSWELNELKFSVSCFRNIRKNSSALYADLTTVCFSLRTNDL